MLKLIQLGFSFSSSRIKSVDNCYKCLTVRLVELCIPFNSFNSLDSFNLDTLPIFGDIKPALGDKILGLGFGDTELFFDPRLDFEELLRDKLAFKCRRGKPGPLSMKILDELLLLPRLWLRL